MTRTTSKGKRGGRALMLALLVALVWPGLADAQSVSPVALFIDHRTRSASLTLFNPGPREAEVEVGFSFGYAQSDSLGHVRVVFSDDPAPAGEPSVVPYLRAFPRQLRLAPGERQVVRVLVTPPADLEDGEYWGRVMVSSAGGQPPVEEVQGGVRMQVSLTTVIAVAVNYRHGSVSTGLQVSEIAAVETEESIDLVTRLDRTGNAAYIGRLVAEVVAANGQVVAQHREDVVAYGPTLWRFSIPKPTVGVPEGATLRYRFEALRDGTTAGSILPAEPVTGSVPIQPIAARQAG